ncbi:MAG: hypothetical protein LAQ30_19610 [Acidobacteriia bacterium]|nr:hypothetical protein [Terriglobia bacterium]
MQLNPNEQALVHALRRMPQAAAEEISALARRLADLGPRAEIDWSDAWSDSDLHDFTADAARRIDSDDQEKTR